MLKIPVDLGDGPADALLCSRRPVYEAVVRQALTAEPIVTVRAGTTVTDLVVRPGQVPVVEGVVTGAGETIRAGLVVDAAGRRSRLSAMLEAHGARPAPATKQGCPLMYISHGPACLHSRLRQLDRHSHRCLVRPVSLIPAHYGRGLTIVCPGNL